MKTIWKQTAAALAAGICICNLTLPAVSAKPRIPATMSTSVTRVTSCPMQNFRRQWTNYRKPQTKAA